MNSPIQLAYSEDAAERGVSDPAVLGEGNVALDLIIHLVAADNEDAAALEQLIGHFLPVLDLGRINSTGQIGEYPASYA